MQCTQFRAKSAKNDLKSTDFLKRNFCFEPEGDKLHMDGLQKWGSQSGF
jgi:hypothetical protein